MTLLCRYCKRELQLFDEFEQFGYYIRIYRCERCRRELNLYCTNDDSIVRELCFWADYYGENIERLKDYNE